ncbi:MAG: type II toxin-antitoxin system RelE/ParE family toxin [Gammaproteobacteria bacterium]|nr:MAG: type II toxin-antitoxin system RelE/ParE family toxin [Gammaproteobacteria bacterium]
MTYSLRIKASAARELARVDKSQKMRLVLAVDRLTENPHRGQQLKGELTGLRRIRVGDYRVIYEIDAGRLVVLVIRVGHRREIYRR